MKKPLLTILIALLGLLFVYSVSYGQADAGEGTSALPTTIETKQDDYVVTDAEVYRRMDRLETLLIEANAKLDAMMPQPGIGEPTPATSHAININTATYDELLTVPGIGPIKAGSIIAERGQGGVFADWADMMKRVSGVGPATIADMQAGGAVLE